MAVRQNGHLRGHLFLRQACFVFLSVLGKMHLQQEFPVIPAYAEQGTLRF